MRKNISVFNEVERLNKHPSLFVNYLKQLARSKGISFDIDEAPYETEEETPSRINSKGRNDQLQARSNPRRAKHNHR